MKNNNLGFSLIETSIAVAVAAVLAVIAVPQYNLFVAKTQLAESVSLMDSVKPATAAAIVKKGLCTADGKNLTVTGKYGVLVVSGTVNQVAVKNSKVRMATGCIFTYTVNTTGVSKLIAGKKVVSDLFNNGNLSKNAATTADVKLIPKALGVITADAAGSKVTPTVPGGPSITNPSDNTGPATPVTPVPVTPTPTPDPPPPTPTPDPPPTPTPVPPPTPEPPAGKSETFKEVRHYAYITNLRKLNPSAGVYQVNYEAFPFTAITNFDFRQPVKESIIGKLDVPVSADAKSADIKLTLADGSGISFTIKHKEWIEYKKAYNFYYKSSITSNCKKVSYCWETLVNNDWNKYKPYSYANNVHIPIENFYRSKFAEYLYEPGTPIPMSQIGQKVTVQYTINY